MSDELEHKFFSLKKMKVYAILFKDRDERLCDFELFDTREKVDVYIEKYFDNKEKTEKINKWDVRIPEKTIVKKDSDYISYTFKDAHGREIRAYIEIEEKEIN